MKNPWKYMRVGIVVLSALVLVACRTGRQAEAPGGPDVQSVKVVDKVNANRLSQETLVGKMNVNIQAGGRTLSVGGNLKMKRNDVIQLSLVAFGFIEAGRVELTQDYILVVDRIGRQYIKEDYRSISFLQQTQLDFYALQALFWSELFVPGKQDRVTTADFNVSEIGQNAVLEAKDTRLLALKFVAGLANGLLKQVNVVQADQLTGPQLNWKYLNFGQVNKKAFPDKMQISVDGLKDTYSVTLTLSGLKEDSKWETRTTVSEAKYKKVSLSSILSRLMNL